MLRSVIVTASSFAAGRAIRPEARSLKPEARSPKPSLSDSFRFPRQAKGDDALQQALVGYVGLLGRLREVFTVREVRVRVGLEHERVVVLVEAEVDARVPAQIERTVDAPRDVPDPVAQRGRQPRRMRQDPG